MLRRVSVNYWTLVSCSASKLSSICPANDLKTARLRCLSFLPTNRLMKLLRRRVDVTWILRCCVKGVKFRLVVFALSCFVSDALPCAFPPTRHVSSTAHHSCVVASSQLNRLLPCGLAVRPAAGLSWKRSPTWPPHSSILPECDKWDSWLARGFHSNWPPDVIISLMRTAIRI